MLMKASAALRPSWLWQIGYTSLLSILYMVHYTWESTVSSPQRLSSDASAAYEIRVQGYLDSTWSDRMGGVAIRSDSRQEGAPITVLTGEFQDQAALAGVLNTLYDLRLPLLSVRCLSVQSQENP